jgi:glucosamine--fructose-6-phosphate aminotransferase (isomerizing)
LLFLFEGEEDLMIAARKGSPLAIGHGDGEMFVGSDAIALAPLTDRITYLEEGRLGRRHPRGRADPRHGRAASPTAPPSASRRRRAVDKAATATSWPRRSPSSRTRLTDALAHYLAQTARSPSRPRIDFARWTA